MIKDLSIWMMNLYSGFGGRDVFVQVVEVDNEVGDIERFMYISTIFRLWL